MLALQTFYFPSPKSTLFLFYNQQRTFSSRSHIQDESEVEKEARSPSQAQEKKDEGAVQINGQLHSTSTSPRHQFGSPGGLSIATAPPVASKLAAV
ncbi:hypothetical protein VTH06DRAFT_3871 [Thermothelomyces fergusii]